MAWDVVPKRSVVHKLFLYSLCHCWFEICTRQPQSLPVLPLLDLPLLWMIFRNMETTNHLFLWKMCCLVVITCVACCLLFEGLTCNKKKRERKWTFKFWLGLNPRSFCSYFGCSRGEPFPIGTGGIQYLIANRSNLIVSQTWTISSSSVLYCIKAFKSLWKIYFIFLLDLHFSITKCDHTNHCFKDSSLFIARIFIFTWKLICQCSP